jgi:hypothetical protein
MKDKFTRAELEALVPNEMDEYREYRVSPKGVTYEIHVWRNMCNHVWVWACKNRIKMSSLSFTNWVIGGERSQRCSNRFVEIID